MRETASIEATSLGPVGGMTTCANLIFVGGIARSGTTLVQNVLDSHPEIRGLPEFFMTFHLAVVRAQFHVLIDKGMISDICDPHDVDRRIRAFLEGFLLRDCGPEHRYVSEKTPDNLFVFTILLELFPEAKFVLVMRDPRAVIHSLLQVASEARRLSHPVEPTMQSLPAAIDYVKRGHKVGWASIDGAPGRVHVVKYEELVTDPVPVTRALCDYLELKWSERMLTPGEFEHATERPITSNPEWYDSKRFRRNIEQTSLETWKRELPPDRQVRIGKAFRGDPRLRELGYEMSLPHLSSPQWFAASMVSSLRSAVGGARLYLKRALD